MSEVVYRKRHQQMNENIVHVAFKNRQNPQAAFDMIRLEELAQRRRIGHSLFKLHLVEFYIIILIEKGECWHTIDFKKYKCSRGTLLTIRKDQIHRFHQSPNVKGSMLLFTDEFLVSYLEKLEALKSLQLFNEFLGAPKLQLTGEQYKEMLQGLSRVKREYFEIGDDFSQGIIRSELHILIAKLYRIKSKNTLSISRRKYLAAFINLQDLIEETNRIHGLE